MMGTNLRLLFLVFAFRYVLADDEETTPSPVPSPTNSTVELCTEEQAAFAQCITENPSCNACFDPLFNKSFTCEALQEAICLNLSNNTCGCSPCEEVTTLYFNCAGQQTSQPCPPLDCEADAIPERNVTSAPSAPATPEATPATTATPEPSETSVPADSVTAAPVPNPTPAPVPQETTSAPAATEIIEPTNAPTQAPSASEGEAEGAPTSSPARPAECQLNSGCAALNLTGLCCPTIDNWILDCCAEDTGPANAQCESNSACAALGLTGQCCPTRDSKFLDCCQTVPNDCQQPGSCERYSAVQYLQEQSQSPAKRKHATFACLSALLVIVGVNF
jgi:hypothetical protein